MSRYIAAAVLSGLIMGGIVSAAEPHPAEKIRIVLVGDSTVCDYPHPPAEKPDLTGWGQVFGTFFNDNIAVFNHAAGGRSSKSFIREGRWSRA
jgi:lysophospholipase L1-like esterase